ncbi:MAG: GNAT family N-acetyltransferase [Nostoc sp. DedQUE08]|uniref:GNAT family N-acetyltransferase n=1 Tax=unclassified Nostoc TaxID=2593658 RepID=UPI002AD434F7|nr:MULTISPECIES: GNAT family N-acetyltransferase [unclassified Nostoc]MDZ8064210.1 GNAT family N-acetyltransferase [Nostoc sp. DedQUE08]MDZ8090897.1 GNAT family N-acetyltransferase [Nostoc sp. DedQUE05]MDZ8127646.1 GNAT family N-acetyltransferase [Nostoc sp. DedQUE07]
MIVKKLTKAHAEDYRQIRLEALEKNPDSFGTTYQEEVIKTIEQFRDRIPVDNNNFILGCFEDKHLIGIVAFNQESRIKLRHKAHISSMYVKQEYREKGIGKLLLKKLIERAKAIKEVEILLLDIVKSNFLAKQLYLSLGFQIYGTQKMAYKFNTQYFDLEFMYLQIKE